MIDKRSLACEPLRVWNRLEPRPRTHDFERCLRNEIHDPVWMLTRQWQFGELQGEEAGSCITAKIALRESRVSEVTFGRGLTARTEPFDVTTSPLAPKALALPQTFDVPARARCGLHFLRVLARTLGKKDTRAIGDALATVLPIGTLEAPESTEPSDVVEYERGMANVKARRLERALSKRAFDGVALYLCLAASSVPLSSLPAPLAPAIPSSLAADVVAALSAYRDWFEGLFGTPRGEAWAAESLEYRLSCAVARDGLSVELVSETDGAGDLDWYAFDIGGPLPASSSEARAFTVIPSPAEFPGMPRSRFWELEDGAVDLAIGQADPTDLARVLVCEFALLYGNNWLVVPCAILRGTLAEVEGILVTDVFGEKTLIEPANRSALDWSSWDFFSLSHATTPAQTDVGAHLFVPATPGSVQRSEPTETVAFVRDEGANMVWALESRVPDRLGGGRDGREAGRALRSRLDRVFPPPLVPPRTEASPSLVYRLGTTVEEHWIPFLPVRLDPASEQVRLQRGSMPRFLSEEIRPIRPTTEILRPGLDGAKQVRPYFVREEEISRSGVRVESAVARTRLPNGAVRVWSCRNKTLGRGEGASGLAFDTVESRS